MSRIQSLVAESLSATVDELCREHGAWKTAHALLLAVWRRRRVRNGIADLSNRMRRDIGLPESEDAPGEARRSFWDVRP